MEPLAYLEPIFGAMLVLYGSILTFCRTELRTVECQTEYGIWYAWLTEQDGRKGNSDPDLCRLVLSYKAFYIQNSDSTTIIWCFVQEKIPAEDVYGQAKWRISATYARKNNWHETAESVFLDHFWFQKDRFRFAPNLSSDFLAYQTWYWGIRYGTAQTTVRLSFHTPYDVDGMQKAKFLARQDQSFFYSSF